MNAPASAVYSVQLMAMTVENNPNVPLGARPAPVDRQIDDVDRAVLRELIAHARISYSELATRCHVSRSTAHARVERLRSLGVVRGYSAVVDPTALGYGICALVFIRIRQHDWRRARDAIAQVAGVESLLMCAGEYDLVATVRCHDVVEFRDTLLVELHAIDDVIGTETAFVLDELRQSVVR